MIEPLSLTVNIDAPRNRFITIGEAICYRVPRKIAKVYPYMAGNDFWILHRVWVHPDHRGKGMATALVQDIVKLAEKRGISLVLRVNPMESKIIKRGLKRLYRRVGFSRVRGSGDLMERL